MSVLRILVVEDTVTLATLYSGQLQMNGFHVDRANDGKAACELLDAGRYDIILLDLGLPDMDGLELLRQWRASQIASQIIVITANASIATAVQAIREGAYDYLIKPVSKPRLLSTVNAALVRLQPELSGAAINDSPAVLRGGFIGSSGAMHAVYEKISAVANSKASVFITGESGTGKEVCAEAIHNQSARAKGDFVAINCGAIPKDLMESEIFGHLKGSFTGAISDREGAALMADGGTLFLDEICEMDYGLQSKLLRFLQTGEVQRVGAKATETVDIRIICATNRDPHCEVAEARFREDLFYRLHVVPIHLPPLRVRGNDIIEIAEHFLDQFSVEEDSAITGLTDDAKAALAGHGWPGNVRELQNVIRQAVVLNPTKTQIDAAMLSLVQAETAMVGDKPMLELDVASLKAAGRGPHSTGFDGLELWKIERNAIESAISNCSGSIPKAAKMLGVSPSTIYRKRESWPLMGPEL